MKVTCDREKLLAAFQFAAAVAPTRSPLPILQNVKLEAGADETILVGTDREIGIRVQVPGVEVHVPGKMLLPTDQFGSILREDTGATLSLEIEGDGIRVTGERTEYRLLSANPDEFPVVRPFHESAYLELPGRLLRELIRRTVFATDSESTRYALGGVLLEVHDQKMTAVGTDGRRLAVMEGPVQLHHDYRHQEGTVIVPAKAMQLIERSLTEGDAEVQLAASGNDLQVRTPRVTVFSRLVEGRFPKWRDVFPRREGSQRIELLTGVFHAAVRQAAIATSEESRGVDLQFGDGKVVLTARAAERGQSRVELPIAYDGPAVAIMLDPRFLGDFLKVLDAEQTFTLEVKDSESAAICSSADGYRYVIMPLARDR